MGACRKEKSSSHLSACQVGDAHCSLRRAARDNDRNEHKTRSQQPNSEPGNAKAGRSIRAFMRFKDSSCFAPCGVVKMGMSDVKKAARRATLLSSCVTRRPHIRTRATLKTLYTRKTEGQALDRIAGFSSRNLGEYRGKKNSNTNDKLWSRFFCHSHEKALHDNVEESRIHTAVVSIVHGGHWSTLESSFASQQQNFDLITVCKDYIKRNKAKPSFCRTRNRRPYRNVFPPLHRKVPYTTTARRIFKFVPTSGKFLIQLVALPSSDDEFCHKNFFSLSASLLPIPRTLSSSSSSFRAHIGPGPSETSPQPRHRQRNRETL
ncbi:unnamed protein product [Trichogramma brassicae]|uniref:Uncharacterized protein n=1 Tax=Trichogramma brassicae TaxID=86971 RepID=A0A6H5I912_9HYME|nr:unnamed protein product [Trichogramma brassicae]